MRRGLSYCLISPAATAPDTLRPTVFNNVVCRQIQRVVIPTNKDPWTVVVVEVANIDPVATVPVIVIASWTEVASMDAAAGVGLVV
jgi:hypothetical protein